MAGMFDDFMSYLMGGTGLGNMLGVTSPTASTQTPVIVPSGPVLGGQPPAGGGGLLSGLLGGQQPVNPMSYFQPRPGLLGDSPLGNALQAGFAGLAAGAGSGGLTGMGLAATGGMQALQDRRKQEMATVLGGQQYQSGQQGLITGNLQNQLALEQINTMRRHFHMPEVSMAQLIADPSLANATPAGGGQSQAGSQPVGGAAPAVPAALTPIPPTYLTTQVPPQTPVAVQYPNQHGIIPPTAAPPTPASRSPVDQLKQAFVNYEGGGDPNKPDPKSGAMSGLMQSTFDGINKQSFGGKLNWANPADRDTANTKLLNDLYQQAGGDVNRIAAAYFTGQMAPANSPTPWVDATATDANGVNVVDYVNHIRKNLMLPPIDAGGAVAQGQASGGQVAAGGQPPVEDAVTQAYQSAIDTAYAQRDFVKAAEFETKLAEYQAAPGHAAQTATATQIATYNAPPAQYDRAQKLGDTYQKDPDVGAYNAAKPAADAFNAAFAERGKPGGSSDYALVTAALQVMTGAPAARPGTLEYATQVQTLPAQIQDIFTKISDPNSTLGKETAARLKQAVDDKIKILGDRQHTVVQNLRKQAKTDAPQVPEGYWRHDLPIPSPDAIQYLHDHPDTVAAFDDTYGAGASKQYGG